MAGMGMLTLNAGQVVPEKGRAGQSVAQGLGQERRLYICGPSAVIECKERV